MTEAEYVHEETMEPIGLIQAIKRTATEETWCRGTLAVDGAGRRLSSFSDPNAARRCLMGWLYFVASEAGVYLLPKSDDANLELIAPYHPTLMAAAEMLNQGAVELTGQEAGDMWASRYNDQGDWAAVQRLLDHVLTTNLPEFPKVEARRQDVMDYDLVLAGV